MTKQIDTEIVLAVGAISILGKYAQARQDTDQKYEEINKACAELWKALRFAEPSIPSLKDKF